MKKKSKHHLVPNYPEDLVALLLQSHLSLLGFPVSNYQFTPVTRQQERHLGYDASVKLDTFMFYMQFKRPYGWLKNAESDIVKDRRIASKKINPHCLYFQLHWDEKAKKNIQHNALYRITCAGEKAAYVCPAELNDSLYKERMRVNVMDALLSWIKGTRPFFFHDVHMHFRNFQPLRIKDVPSFKHHISIPPHACASDEIHHISFSTNCDEAFYHGGEPLNSFVFGDWLQEIYGVPMANYFDPNGNESKSRLESICNSLEDLQRDFIVPKKVDLETWKNFGDFLLIEYRILQYAICRPQSDASNR